MSNELKTLTIDGIECYEKNLFIAYRINKLENEL